MLKEYDKNMIRNISKGDCVAWKVRGTKYALRRSGMSNINVRALATMGIQKNYLRNIIKASYAMKVTSWSVGFSFEDMLIF